MKRILIIIIACVLLSTVMIIVMIPQGRKETEDYNTLCNECGYDKFTAKTQVLTLESIDLNIYECGKGNLILTDSANQILNCDIKND